MIAKTKVGKSFGGLVKYALDPKKNPEILDSKGVRTDRHQHATQDFNFCRELKPSIGKAVWHTSLSFAYQDKVDNNKMKAIAQEFIQGIGLDNSQYLIVRHHDAQHEHLHIIGNRVQLNGEVVPDQFSVNRSAKLSDQLEEKYQLIIARNQKSKKVNDKVPVKKQVRQAIAIEIRNSLETGCRSIEQLSNELKKSGITLQLQKQGTGRINGISFRKDDLSFKGSAVDRDFSYGRLMNAFDKQQVQEQANDKKRQDKPRRNNRLRL